MPLPKKEGYAYQVPTPKDGGSHVLTTATDTKTKNTAFDTKTPVISVYPTTDTWYRLSSNSTESTTVGNIPTSANWHFLPANTLVHLGIGADLKEQRRYFHALAVSSAGSVYISESD